MGLTQSQALGIVGQILSSLDRSYTGFTQVIDAVIDGATKADQQIRDFQRFDFDPKWKTRVINVPSAIDQAQGLWLQITSHSPTSLLGKVDAIVNDTKSIIAALQNIPPRAPGEPILQRTALILNYVYAFNTELSGIVTSILDLSQTILEIKSRVENLDVVFLSQANRKVTMDVHYRKREKS